MSLLVAVLGPTATGKTELAVRLAERFGGEIVSCDSVALYREFNIGSAKPTTEQRARAPHHLVDVASPTEHVTAGQYSRWGRDVIAEISGRGHLPILVGGTGLYLRALLEGLSPAPPRSEALRQRLRNLADAKGSPHLHAVLKRLDPSGAAAIRPNDTPKLIRALEVYMAARVPLSELWKGGREPLEGHRILRIGLNPDRDRLYDRINARVRTMFESGLVEETERLLARYGEHPWPFRSLGYRQAVELLRGHLRHETAVEAVQQAHRNYAKRQLTWFRKEPGVQWLTGFGDDPRVQQQAVAIISETNT
jgi:tRNA dimethylallyltransferase